MRKYLDFFYFILFILIEMQSGPILDHYQELNQLFIINLK